MAMLPPPPTKAVDGSYAWLDWYRKLYAYVAGGGAIPWSAIDFTGSKLSDIVDKPHNILTGIQGGAGSEFYHLTAAQHANAIIAVPNTRTLTAGAGLTGGGDLTANRTFDVGANADGSITVNANDIQVGVLASDAQHGVRGGGTQHAVATTSTNGFLSAADKAKLDTLGGSDFRAYRSTAQAIGASAFTTIVFDTQEWDDFAEYNPATGVFSPNVTGRYTFFSGIHGTQVAVALRVISLFVNGTETVRMQQTDGDTGNGAICGASGTVSLTAGDSVTLRYFTSIAENTSTGSATVWFSGFRVK